MITVYRSTVQETGTRARLLRAEAVKLLTVPRRILTLSGAVLLTLLVAGLAAAGTETAGGDGSAPPPGYTLSPYSDAGHFVGTTLTGDGSISVRVTEQDPAYAGAKAGLMIRRDDAAGSPYAAVLVTPGRGVRFQTGFHSDVAGPNLAAPVWLRLTRTGERITGYASADGAAWTEVGHTDLAGLPSAARIGMFVAVPDDVEVVRQFGGESVGGDIVGTTAVFADVAVSPAPHVAWTARERTAGSGAVVEEDGRFTISGAGDVGPDLFGNDVAASALTAVLLALIVVAALAVLSVTAEYRSGTIRTTFLAAPARGRVLAAKATVTGAAGLLTGLVAAVGSYVLTAPMYEDRGLHPADLTAWPVLRAVLGTGLLVALAAVFAVGVAAALRRAAAAIPVVVVALLLPQLVAGGMPVAAAVWLERLTPAAGFAAQQTITRYDTALPPAAGLGVLAAYAGLALAVAALRLRRRDA